MASHDVELILWAESGWVSPWVLHAVVALEEKRLPYRLELTPLPIPAGRRDDLMQRGLVAKVPVLVHGEYWLGESLAISEYLAETFPVPDHPRLFPADLKERGLARQIMGFLRTDLFALREARPTSSVFGGTKLAAPLKEKAQANAAELVRLASRVVKPGAKTMFGDWCIADIDLGMALMRLAANNDDLPEHLAAYARAQFARPSARVFLDRAARQHRE